MDKFSHATAQGQAAVDGAADAVQGGLDRVGSTISDGIESARSNTEFARRKTKESLARASGQFAAATDQIRSRAGQAADSISRYTRDNPTMALLLAAATGAALLALLRAVTPARD